VSVGDSRFGTGVLDAGYRYDLTVPEAIALGQRAIFHATHRDAYSGGFINGQHLSRVSVSMLMGLFLLIPLRLGLGSLPRARGRLDQVSSEGQP